MHLTTCTHTPAPHVGSEALTQTASLEGGQETLLPISLHFCGSEEGPALLLPPGSRADFLASLGRQLKPVPWARRILS